MKVLPEVLSQLVHPRNSARFSSYREAGSVTPYAARAATGWLWSTSTADRHLWDARSDGLPFVSKNAAVFDAREKGFTEVVWVVRGRVLACDETRERDIGIRTADHTAPQRCAISDFELCGDDPERID